ncbi:3-isopropylmalate dehydratase small subunit [Rhizobium sp. XQZ8]|uniref:3-isopropylmalate dehydratase small subunit n=1 Tax=Rhizobium populisoli TaxID=2859785 RepID=UPI001CA4F843|nr:3-isopropylmalate dehydratase small subunit [Rhizobium populisoli]MBW6425823.1 3-isopropylmalate dehydratase small subunit [Rhizobium populisoli]
MKPFKTLDAVACPLPQSNVDTDQLIPARFMKRSRADGYGGFLLYDLRFDETGAQKADCPLNDTIRQGAQILVSRRNFGSGSSREAAVYALVDYGITCVIAPSYGDIFASNSVNNGLLPAVVSEEDCEALLAGLQDGAETATVDLEALTIRCANLVVPFTVDPVWRTKLLNGWDDIDLTRSHAEAIAAFAASDRERRPWMQPNRPATASSGT